MLVKHDTASSVGTGDGEIHGKDGIFDVPAELGAWLIRVFGFRAHEGATPDTDAPAEAPKKPRAKRQPKKPTNTVVDDKSDGDAEGATPDTDAPAE